MKASETHELLLRVHSIVAAARAAKDAETIEPPCELCVSVRRASGGALSWCAAHSRHRPRMHLHYEYPRRFAVGSMLIRPEG